VPRDRCTWLQDYEEQITSDLGMRPRMDIGKAGVLLGNIASNATSNATALGTSLRKRVIIPK